MYVLAKPQMCVAALTTQKTTGRNSINLHAQDTTALLHVCRSLSSFMNISVTGDKLLTF